MRQAWSALDLLPPSVQHRRTERGLRKNAGRSTIYSLLNVVCHASADIEAMGITDEEILYEFARQSMSRQAGAVPDAEKPTAAGSI